MLLAIRERVMGVVGWVILGLLIITFAFFGLNSYLGDPTAVYAASVNGVEISAREENRAYQTLRRRMEETMGASFDPALINEGLLRREALDQLINEELLYQQAVNTGLASSDQQIAAQISSIDVFRDNGKFSSQRYEQVLANQGLSTARFEAQLRRGIVIDQLRAGIVQTAVPTPDQLEQAYRLQGQKRRFDYLLVPVSDFNYQVSVTNDEIKAFYDNHTSDYLYEQKVKLQYLELDVSNLSIGLEPGDDMLRELYEDEAARFTTEEQRKARHILVLFKDSSEEQIAAATRKAENIINRLDAGEAFGSLARQLSEDPGSADQGGDLGFFTRGIMVPEFENVVFDMQAGERSAPVRSAYGLHIIELLEIKPEAVKPFEEVREELASQLLNEERGDRFFEQSEVLSNLAFEHPESLSEAATALGLAIRESDWLGPGGGEGVWKNPAVINAAFSDDVLLEGNNSETVELDEGHVIVIRVAEHRKAEPKPLEEVEYEIRQRLQDEKARALAQAKGLELLEAVQAGSTLEEMAGRESLQARKTGLVGRTAAEPDRLLIDKAFNMARPVEERDSIDGLVMPNGDYAILQVQQVIDGRLASLNENARAQLGRELARIRGTSDMQAMMKALKTDAKIHIPDSDERL